MPSSSNDGDAVAVTQDESTSSAAVKTSGCGGDGDSGGGISTRDDKTCSPSLPALGVITGSVEEKEKEQKTVESSFAMSSNGATSSSNHKKERGRRDRRGERRNKRNKRPRPSSSEQHQEEELGGGKDVESDEGPSFALRARVVPLELEKGKPIYSSSSSSSSSAARWVRLIEPYPYTFKSFAKQRWVGRSILDVYSSEFGSYPPSYYQAAIQQGRILVNNNQRVDPSYLIKATDVLQHTVHRHEPAVAVSQPSPPFVTIVADTNSVLVVDKPACLPIHPCGGYHCNSLIPLLTSSCNDYKKLYTIHRLDRLTSGLVVLGKSSQVAADWAQAIQARDCQKLYLARVRGQFPRNLLTIPTHKKLIRLGIGIGDHARGDETSASLPVNGEWQQEQTDDLRRRNAHGWWITNNARGDALDNDVTLEQLAERPQQDSVDAMLEALAKSDDSYYLSSKDRCRDANGNHFYWLHLACPMRVVEPKNGVCACGTFDDLPDSKYRTTVKACHTSFAVLSYHAESDSTLVLCRPHTGRTHQIRIHLQYLGHSIANDPNYGGEMWYHNPQGLEICRQAQALLNAEDDDDDTSNNGKNGGGIGSSGSNDGSSSPPHSSSLVTSDEPATEKEVQQCLGMNADGNDPNFYNRRDDGSVVVSPRGDNTEPQEAFLRRTCVWCARNRSGRDDRAALELLVRSSGIWLHALQYSAVLNCERVAFRTDLPDWARSIINSAPTSASLKQD